jgi:hypothetical protein
MNERIRELATQAREQTEEFNSVKNKLTTEEWEEIYNEKFAELIVQEMLDITDAHTKVFHTDQDKVFIEYIKQSVKQHFGAER